MRPMIPHLPSLLLIGLLLGVACGEDTTETGTEATENEYCEQPDYPTDGSANNSCGCGYAAAFYKEQAPYYLDCVSEACGLMGDCLPADRQPVCLWDGDGTTSPGSWCAAPCGAGQQCPVVDGVQTVCSELLCIIPCGPNYPCPGGMRCIESTTLTGVDDLYCIYDFEP